MEVFSFEPGPAFARNLDSQDDLVSFRTAFVSIEPDLIYLDGNILGRLSFRTREYVYTVFKEEWGGRVIRG